MKNLIRLIMLSCVIAGLLLTYQNSKKNPATSQKCDSITEQPAFGNVKMSRNQNSPDGSSLYFGPTTITDWIRSENGNPAKAFMPERTIYYRGDNTPYLDNYLIEDIDGNIYFLPLLHSPYHLVKLDSPLMDYKSGTK